MYNISSQEHHRIFLMLLPKLTQMNRVSSEEGDNNQSGHSET